MFYLEDTADACQEDHLAAPRTWGGGSEDPGAAAAGATCRDTCHLAEEAPPRGPCGGAAACDAADHRLKKKSFTGKLTI